MPGTADPRTTSREPPARTSIGVRIGAALVIGMFCLVGLMGLMTLYAGLRLLVTGEQHWGTALLVIVMGIIFSGIGLGFLYVRYVKEPVWQARERAIAARYPGQPWMLRADWAARRITDSSLGAMIFLWIWVVGWWGGILFIWTMNRDKILAAAAESWWQAALGLIFPICGLIGLMFAWKVTRSWWRYGSSTLRIDTLPGYLGETFRGTVEANLGTRPQEPLQAEIVCEEAVWRTSRNSKGETTRERVLNSLWSATHPIASSRIVMTAARASIPINVPLPADQPAWNLDASSAGIQWRLHVRSSDHDLGAFGCTFEIPVFARKN